jgi:putative salt-induced outer membrane protein YdiY
MMKFPRATALAAISTATLALIAPPAHAGPHVEPTLKDDGLWRSALGIALNASGGNTRAATLSITANAVAATPVDKTSLYASVLYGVSQGTKTADQARLGVKHDWNLSERLYVFGLLEGERDRLAKLNSRVALGSGMGWKFFNTDAQKFEVFGGLGYTADRYAEPRLVDNVDRMRYAHGTLLFGEESMHKVGVGTTLRQRFVTYPDLAHGGEYRVQWDMGIAVAATETLSITAGLNLKYTSDPGDGLKRGDALFTTGISVKFD